MAYLDKNQRARLAMGPKNSFIVGSVFISIFFILLLLGLYSLFPIKTKLQVFYVTIVLLALGGLIYAEIVLVKDYLEENPKYYL